MVFPLGILASSRFVPSGSFDLLESQILMGSTASVTFSNLSNYASAYQHLQLRIVSRTNRTGADSDPVLIQFNGDANSNYTRHSIGAYNFNNTSAMYTNAAPSQTSIFLSENMPVASSNTDAFGAIIADILDPFESAKNTTVNSLNGMNAAWSSVELRSGAWLSTAPLTSMTIKPLVGGGFVSNCRFSLYGIKVA